MCMLHNISIKVREKVWVGEEEAGKKDSKRRNSYPEESN